MKNIEAIGYSNWRNNTLNAKLITDKKYLVLKMGASLISSAGFGTYVMCVLNGIRFGIENGFIPVVDWQNLKMPQYDVSKVGKENIWEYFFEQPCNVSIEQAYESENYYVIDDIGGFNFTHRITSANFKDFYNEGLVIWRKYFHSYIRFTKEVKEYFDNCIEQQFVDTKNTIGIKARGTDYKVGKPTGHYSPILEDELFEQVDELIKKMDDYKIFLATEDKDILQNFESRYQGKVYSEDTKRYEIFGHEELPELRNGENGYDRDLKFLYAIYVISKCPIGIYSACGGSILASLMRDESGICYKFLSKGMNKPKGIIVGSYMEKEKGNIILMGGKPIMFYALNVFKLLSVEEIDIIVSDAIKSEYERIIGLGREFGIKINYVISDTYDAVEYMTDNPDFMTTSRLVLLYADSFVHGNKVVAELSAKAYQADGAYIWGSNEFLADDVESIQIDRTSGMPQKAYVSYKQGNYSLMGKYVFDYDLPEIIAKIYAEKGKRGTLVDILNEYIMRKKLFFTGYESGTIFTLLKDKDILDKTDQIILLLEELQGQKIGDFEFFRKTGRFD